MDNVTVPKRLTAENGAKKLLMGEFQEYIESPCPGGFHEDDEDIECQCCGGTGEHSSQLTISWHTIKAIWAKAIDHFQAHPIITDAEKGEAYWRARHFREVPEFVPTRINIPKAIQHKSLTVGPGAFDCIAEVNGVPRIWVEGSYKMVVRPFTVLEWRKNEAANEQER